MPGHLAMLLASRLPIAAMGNPVGHGDRRSKALLAPPLLLPSSPSLPRLAPSRRVRVGSGWPQQAAGRAGLGTGRAWMRSVPGRAGQGRAGVRQSMDAECPGQGRAGLGSGRAGLGAAPGGAGRAAGGGSATSPAFQSPSLRGGNREIFPAGGGGGGGRGGGLAGFSLPARRRGGMRSEGRLPAGRAG